MNVTTPSFAWPVVAAALVLVYGILRDRRDLGWRAAWGVLGAALGAALAGVLIFAWPGPIRMDGRLMLALSSIQSVLLDFWPLAVAANWAGIIRTATMTPEGTNAYHRAPSRQG